MRVTRPWMHSRRHDPRDEPGVLPEDELVIPHPKRLTFAWLEADGQARLHLYYGTTGVCFDAPDLLGFGERLLETERFRAKDTNAWSRGEPYRWEVVKSLLDVLLAEDILRRASDLGDAAPMHPPPPEEAAAPRAARTWSAADGTCPALTAELTGSALEIGHLEVVVPIHRIAHPALDTDGRQLGEEEVVPRFLYLRLPTELRSCNYPGSRHHDAAPMNMSALRLTMKHWDHVLALTVELRDRFTARSRRTGPRWRIGDLHLLAIAALAAPAYLMVRGEEPIRNGELPASLATLFKIVDGVRIVTIAYLLDPGQTATVDTEISADDVFDYSERHALLLGRYGVCAGPPAHIRQFLDVLMNGASTPATGGPGLDALLGDVETVIDYAAAATQLECVVLTFLERQQVAARGLLEIVRAQSSSSGALAALGPTLERVLAAPPPLRTPRTPRFHASLFAEAGRHWNPSSPWFEGTLDAVLGGPRPHDPTRARELGRFLPELPADATELVDAYFAEERMTLGVVREQEKVINALLRRPQPERPLTGEELQGRFRLAGADVGAALALFFDMTLERGAECTRLTRGERDFVLRG